jgi:glycosyltransferase involved in cell wall biosynthesis
MNMQPTPAITVLMPAYNAAPHIAEAINSILHQTFADFELLIVNDGSTDGTEGIVRSYEDSRIVLINRANGGVAAALNTGLKVARGIYIARFDADDVCYPNRLTDQYNFMQAHTQYHIVGSGADYMDQSGNMIFTNIPFDLTKKRSHAALLRTCPFIHSSVIYRKDSILEFGGYNEHAHTFEDHLLWLQVLKKYQGFNLRQSLIKVRLTPESVTMDERWHHPIFRKIKLNALSKGFIDAVEGEVIDSILRAQRKDKVNYEAYYGILAKKFLWNNHDRELARQYLGKLLKITRYRFGPYGLLLLSALPGSVISNLYQIAKKCALTNEQV